MRKCTFTPSFEEKTAQELKKKKKTSKISYLQDISGWKWGEKEREWGRKWHFSPYQFIQTYLMELCYFTYFFK